MVVYILTYCDNSEHLRIIQNLGVFTKRSMALLYLQEIVKIDRQLGGGKFKAKYEDLKHRENELDYNPKSLVLYEQPFNKVCIEVSFLK